MSEIKFLVEIEYSNTVERKFVYMKESGEFETMREVKRMIKNWLKELSKNTGELKIRIVRP